MFPVLLGSYDTVFVVWAVAIVVGIIVSLVLLRQDGAPLGRDLAALGVLVLTFLAGTKVHFWMANQELVRHLGFGPLLLYGFHFPGGILATVVIAPPLIRALGFRPLAFFDTIAPAAALSIAVARIGCFANGCCFGYVSNKPWALAFPAGSRAHEHHLRLGMIGPDDPFSLPVLPLSLFFSAAALVIAVLLWFSRPRRRFDGQLSLMLVALWASTNVVIESWRDPRMVPGSPHLWETSVIIAGVSVPLLIGLSYARWHNRIPLPALVTRRRASHAG